MQDANVTPGLQILAFALGALERQGEVRRASVAPAFWLSASRWSPCSSETRALSSDY